LFCVKPLGEESNVNPAVSENCGTAGSGGIVTRQMSRNFVASVATAPAFQSVADTPTMARSRDGRAGHGYCAWLDSNSEEARRHANKEDIRYQKAALPTMENKTETAESVTSSSATSKTAKVILNNTEAVVVTGMPSV
jgi:hypothetical protein